MLQRLIKKERNMAKGRDAKKSVKKAAALTKKEKKAKKQEKKRAQ